MTPEEIRQRFPHGVRRPYEFKALEEFGWFVAVAVASVLAQELLTFDANAITDWRTWVVALVSALIRAAAGAALAYAGGKAIRGTSHA